MFSTKTPKGFRLGGVLAANQVFRDSSSREPRARSSLPQSGRQLRARPGRRRRRRTRRPGRGGGRWSPSIRWWCRKRRRCLASGKWATSQVDVGSDVRHFGGRVILEVKNQQKSNRTSFLVVGEVRAMIDQDVSYYEGGGLDGGCPL